MFSSETRLPFSFNKVLFEFKPLLLKQGLIAFQKLRLSGRSFLTFILLRISLLLIIFPIFKVFFSDERTIIETHNFFLCYSMITENVNKNLLKMLIICYKYSVTIPFFNLSSSSGLKLLILNSL